jgi:hypothetical protein
VRISSDNSATKLRPRENVAFHISCEHLKVRSITNFI